MRTSQSAAAKAAEAAAKVAAAEQALAELKREAEGGRGRGGCRRTAGDSGTGAANRSDHGPDNPAGGAAGPLNEAEVDAVRAGYGFTGAVLEMGALVNGDALADVPIRIPIAMLNRHGLVAGATGTGKTKTLQVLAEQLSANGVPVFAADIKGDLSGIATAGTPSDKLLARTTAIGQDWRGVASPTEYFSLGGIGAGVPIRATVSGFGSLLLAKVLGLNDVQESSLGLVFHYAEEAGSGPGRSRRPALRAQLPRHRRGEDATCRNWAG